MAKVAFQRLWVVAALGATTLPAAEVSNYALSFDGTNDLVQAGINSFSNVVNSFTIELWANPTGFRAPTVETNAEISDINQRFAVFPDHGDNYGANRACAGLSIGTNGISVFEHAINYLPSVLVYTNNISGWTHVALVYSNGQPRIYLNGTLALMGLPSTKAFVHPSASLGGSVHAPGLGPFQGQLDEVRIWSAPLSQAQIQANMNRSLTGVGQNLVVYFPCDEGAGLALTDQAPAGRAVNGTLTNGTSWVPSGVSLSPPLFTDLNAGYLTKLRFDNIGNGVNVFDLLNHPKYMNDQYDFMSLRTEFSANDGEECDNCGYVVRGLFIPTASGPHIFYIAADDGGVLFLSPDESPANKVLIASEPVWASRRNYIGEAEGGGRGDPPFNRSAPIHLTAGARYYIEGAVKEASGGDNLDVAVQGPGDAPVADGDQPIFGNRIATVGLPGVAAGSVAWGDFDNDGDLDILLTGSRGSVPIAHVYRNNGNGTFTDINAGLPGVYSSSVAWGDYDNDGDLDILLTGRSTSNFLISRVYRNNGTFTDLNAGLPGVESGSVAWGDFDDDGDLDILLTGSGGSVPIAHVYRNNGNSTFTDLNADLPGVESSSVAWGDFDNDDDLDILLTGKTDDGFRRISLVYRNNGNGTFTSLEADLPGVDNSSVAWGDFDNDGDLDILLIGNSSLESGGFVPISRVYRNNGNGTFTDLVAGLHSVANGSAAWGDFDNDGDPDILLTGSTSFGGISRVYRNNTPQANTPPHAPTGLTVAVNQGTATLSWNAATDAQTPGAGLTYNVRVGTTPGASDVLGPMASAGGVRRLPQMGNAQQGLTASLKYNDNAPYYWSVQAVDSAFAGSGFATERSFKILDPPPVVVLVTTTNLAPGDLNGDGLVDQNELNTVLSNYFPNSSFLQMTNVAGLGGTNVTFALSNSTAGAFSVEVTTNLLDWLFLGPATPRYEFTDTNAPAEPQRYYRLRWP